MAMNSLKDVYFSQLQDMHSSCSQSLGIVDEMGRAAADKELSEALIAGHQGISDGLGKLKRLCSDNDIDPDGEFCKATQGLVAEAREHAIEETFGSEEAQDAMIAAQYQRLVYYALTGYGTLVAFANRLGLDGDAAILQDMLDDTYDGDRRMTAIAAGSAGLNAAAAE